MSSVLRKVKSEKIKSTLVTRWIPVQDWFPRLFLPSTTPVLFSFFYLSQVFFQLFLTPYVCTTHTRTCRHGRTAACSSRCHNPNQPEHSGKGGQGAAPYTPRLLTFWVFCIFMFEEKNTSTVLVETRHFDLERYLRPSSNASNRTTTDPSIEPNRTSGLHLRFPVGDKFDSLTMMQTNPYMYRSINQIWYLTATRCNVLVDWQKGTIWKEKKIKNCNGKKCHDSYESTGISNSSNEGEQSKREGGNSLATLGESSSLTLPRLSKGLFKKVFLLK